MSENKVAVAGVTGKLGSLIAAALLDLPNVTVHGICRNPSRVPENLLSNPKLKLFQAECHETETLRAALQGTSACICCYLGDLEAVFLTGQKILIEACIAEKVPRYIASDYNFDFRGLKLGDIPLKDHQILIKNHLEEKQGLITGVHILCGIFLETFFAPFFPPYDAETQTLRVWGTGDEVLEMTTYVDTAKFVAAVAVDSNAGGFMGFIGDSKTTKEVTQVYQKVYGEELKLDIQGPIPELLKVAIAAQQEHPENLFAWVFKLLYYFILNGQAALKNLDVDRVEGLQPLSLEQFFEKHERKKLPQLVSL